MTAAADPAGHVAGLRSRLATRRPVVLMNPDSADPDVILRLVRFGFREIFLDMESGLVSEAALPDLCTRLRAAGAIAFVRPRDHRHASVAACLAAGALGIVAPGVADPAMARELCDSVAESSVRPRPLILAIIESVAALPHVDALAAISQIEAYMIGPRDLGLSMQPPCRPDDTRVTTLVRAMLQQLTATGKAAGTPVSPGRIAELSEAGCCVYYVHANGLDEAAMKRFVALAQS